MITIADLDAAPETADKPESSIAGGFQVANDISEVSHATVTNNLKRELVDYINKRDQSYSVIGHSSVQDDYRGIPVTKHIWYFQERA